MQNELTVSGLSGTLSKRSHGFEWGDIDWENLAIFVRRSVVAGRFDETKTGASQHRLPLDPDLATAAVTLAQTRSQRQ
jgi:hypothetical protein